MKSKIDQHIMASIKAKQEILANQPIINNIEKIATQQVRILTNGGKLLFAGNGGSAADAQHLSAEYVSKLKRDRAPLASIAISTDTSALTAIGNDYGFEHLFSRQLSAVGTKCDLLVGISTSGNSKNIINAFIEARRIGMYTVGFFGQSSGDCARLCDVSLNVPSAETAIVQECHIMLGHIICALVEEKIYFA